jgi:hypothetical protein
LGLKTPASGHLVGLDVVEGRDALPAAKKHLKSYSMKGGVSVWDASRIFVEINGLEIGEKPSPRNIVLLYAADLFFRLRWEIFPLLEEGKCAVAAPYVETAFAFGVLAGLPKKWLTEVFVFAPQPRESLRVSGYSSAKLGTPTRGFVEFCSSTLNEDLRPKFASYFEELDREGRSRAV